MKTILANVLPNESLTNCLPDKTAKGYRVDEEFLVRDGVVVEGTCDRYGRLHAVNVLRRSDGDVRILCVCN